MMGRRRLVDATVAALHLRLTYGCELAPATIRSWAKRGHITRHGAGRRGAHFDLNEVDSYAKRRLDDGTLAADDDLLPHWGEVGGAVS